MEAAVCLRNFLGHSEPVTALAWLPVSRISNRRIFGAKGRIFAASRRILPRAGVSCRAGVS
eukprot:881864-Rhodomonas_salina.2